MAVAGLPWLRRSPWDPAARREWLSQQLEHRNTNPYLAGLVLGASLRFREQAAPAAAHRFESGLDRAAGALGDALMWGGLWPGFGLLAAVAGWLMGPAAAAAIWALFGFTQGWIRMAGLDRGYALGAEVVALLEHARARRAVSLARAGALAAGGALAGVVVVAVGGSLWTQPGPGLWLLVGAVAAGVGTLVAARSWPPERGAVLMLAGAWAASRMWQWLG